MYNPPGQSKQTLLSGLDLNFLNRASRSIFSDIVGEPHGAGVAAKSEYRLLQLGHRCNEQQCLYSESVCNNLMCLSTGLI